ncbi:MAG: cation:proton antiporter [Candidatus Diapherotrites archaeon]
MVAVEVAFLVVAAIIIIGYIGMLLFKKTKVSDILILMAVGLILGPVSSYLGPNGTGMLPFELLGQSELALFQGFLPFFAAFALIIILFEGGLHLNFFKVIKSFGESFAFTIIVFFLSIAFVILVLWAGSNFGLLKFDLLVSLMIGAIIGGTSSAIVIPLVNSTKAGEETKTLLSLESALTDALCVIVAVAAAEIILLNSFNVSQVGTSLLGAFTIAAFLGLIAGLVWLRLLSLLRDKPYEYLMTLGVLLLLYTITVFFGGNGAIAALTFGLVLGNSEDITRMLRLTPRSIDWRIKSFQAEVSFLVRTFFFVYLGLLFKFEFFTPGMIAVSLAIMFLFLLARRIGAVILKKFKPVFAQDQKLITTMAARGLAAAVLISLPTSMGLNLDSSVLNMITTIVFLIICFSNIVATIGVFLSEKERAKKEKSEDKKPQEIKIEERN